jgi:4-hydroxybenzoate polyprenyltransferase/phosphoserine phosphatase
MTNSRVLVVDLDHSLVKTDLLLEAFVTLIKNRPSAFLNLFLVIFSGGNAIGASCFRTRIKEFLAQAVAIQPETLPYNDQVLLRIKQERQLGSHVVLASASHQRWVDAVANHLGLFHEAVGSTLTCNLKGSRKLEFIRSRFSLSSAIYIGDSAADIPIWKSVSGALVVEPTVMMKNRLNSLNIRFEVLGRRAPFFRSLIKAIRVHQWAKNVLLFVPLILAHKFSDISALMNAITGFFAFSFLASTVYVLNDLLDLASDRVHPKKRNRPFASGALSIRFGLGMLPILLGIAALLTAQLSAGFALTLLGYFVVNLAYSFRLKKTHSLDVVLLACMYTLRVFAGGSATETPVSDWFLSFSTFFFFGLALLKRYTEVSKMVVRKASGRGYFLDDKSALLNLGISSSLLSTVIFSLYINSPQVTALYTHPQHLWLALPILLFWVCRLWIQASRNEVDSDPVVHALKDKVSYFTAVAVLSLIFLAK